MTIHLNTQDDLEEAIAVLVKQDPRLKPVLARAPFPVHLVRAGSLVWMSFHEQGAPRTAATLSERETARFARLFHAMLARGVYLPPSAYEACFLSLAHSRADLTQFTEALGAALAEIP